MEREEQRTIFFMNELEISQMCHNFNIYRRDRRRSDVVEEREEDERETICITRVEHFPLFTFLCFLIQKNNRSREHTTTRAVCQLSKPFLVQNLRLYGISMKSCHSSK